MPMPAFTLLAHTNTALQWRTEPCHFVWVCARRGPERAYPRTVPLCLCEAEFVATLDSGDSRASAICMCRSFGCSLLPVTVSRTLHLTPRGRRFILKSDRPGHSPSEIFNSRSVRAASCFCAPNSGHVIAILALPGELNRRRLQRRHDLPSAIYHRSSRRLGDADPCHCIHSGSPVQ